MILFRLFPVPCLVFPGSNPLSPGSRQANSHACESPNAPNISCLKRTICHGIVERMQFSRRGLETIRKARAGSEFLVNSVYGAGLIFPLRQEGRYRLPESRQG